MPPVRRPRWFWVPLRALLVTVLLTLLCFAVSLLGAIFTLMVTAVIGGTRPNLAVAYRHFALPVALAAAPVALIVMLVVETRNYRQARALAEIERTS